MAGIATISLEGDERWRAVQRILASPLFARAPRMRALLAYLMIRKLAGQEDTINEQAIAVDVFQRDPQAFDAKLDRVAHVQASGLRERLARYYALYEPAAPWQVAIPGGELVPAITRETGDQPVTRVTIELASLRVPVIRAARRMAKGRRAAGAARPPALGAPLRCTAAAGWLR